ncbi:hypothetical protein [Egicoccus sp. AB-alg2]|uniref:hypothetical protein n=1 Tax=Egicoccus sp. AB-alg2 TaxID=3242693 RepID=UPI00359CF4FB
MAWGAGEIVELPELEAASATRIDGAASLGAVIAAMQERATAVERQDAPVTARWGGPAWVLAGAYGVVVLAAFLAATP